MNVSGSKTIQRVKAPIPGPTGIGVFQLVLSEDIHAINCMSNGDPKGGQTTFTIYAKAYYNGVLIDPDEFQVSTAPGIGDPYQDYTTITKTGTGAYRIDFVGLQFDYFPASIIFYGEHDEDGTILKSSPIFSIIQVKDGNVGAAPVYRGVYQATTHYCGTAVRTDLVQYTNPSTHVSSYFKATQTAGADFVGHAPTDTQYWEPFGNSFSSVATDLLLAENANIANFIFKNQRMESQAVDVNGNPFLLLNGINGEINAKIGNIGAFNIIGNLLKSGSMEFGDTPVESLALLLSPVNVTTPAVTGTDVNTHTAYMALTMPSTLSFKVTTTLLSSTTGMGFNIYVRKYTSGYNYGGDAIAFSDYLPLGTAQTITNSVSLPAGDYYISVELAGSPTDNISVQIDSPTNTGTITAAGYVSQTKIGNNGLYSFWGGTSLFYFSSSYGLEIRFGTYILQMTSSYFRASLNSGSTWHNL